MTTEPKKKSPVDLRTIGYRLARRTLVLIGIVIIIKFLFLDIIAIKGDQMEPTLQSGDYVLVLRLKTVPFIHSLFRPGRNQPVIFTFPQSKKLGCLRLAAVSGDTVEVVNGTFRNANAPWLQLPIGKRTTDILPAEFSPRDHLPKFRIPAPGDVLLLDSLDLCALFFTIAAIRQEHPLAAIKINADLSINDTLANDFYIADFALHEGVIDSIPDTTRQDWFFWYRLNGYLRQATNGQAIALKFAVSMNGSIIKRYVVTEPFTFCIADNWKTGLDSRYFGPIALEKCIYRPLAVVWSYGGEKGEKKRLKFNRLGKFL